MYRINDALPSKLFKPKGSSQTEVELHTNLVSFRRLLHSSGENEIDKALSNEDLLHGVVALYNSALPNISPDVIYSSVCDKYARTFIITLPDVNALELYCHKHGSDPLVSASDEVNFTHPETTISNDVCDGHVSPIVIDEELAEKNCPNCKPSKYADVFSDEEPSTSSSEDDAEEEDFSVGADEFIQAVKQRRRTINKIVHDRMKLPLKLVKNAVEHRLVAALTFERSFLISGEALYHITLLTVRPSFRKYGIGRHLLELVKNCGVIGDYNTIAVLADQDAVEFFKRNGFSTDPLLTSRYAELEGTWTNVTIMCYVNGLRPPKDLSMVETVDKAIEQWQSSVLESHSKHMIFIRGLREHILEQNNLIKSYQDALRKVTENQDSSETEVEAVKGVLKKYLFQFLSFMEPSDKVVMESFIYNGESSNSHNAYTDENLNLLSRDLSSLDIFKARISEEFIESIVESDGDAPTTVDVDFVNIESSEMTLERDADDELIYFTGSIDNSDIERIKLSGFSNKDFTHGDYGQGLYFSRYAHVALKFSKISKVLLCKVCLGNIKTTLASDPSLTSLPSQYGSLLCPGRLHINGLSRQSQKFCQEYVIFDTKQALLLGIINYKRS